MRSCEKGNVDAIKTLLKAGANHSIVDDEGETWLHDAIRGNCCKEVVQLIVDQGADVNATNNENVTALMRACEHG